MFYKHSTNSNVLYKLTCLNDFPLDEGPINPTGQFKQSLDIPLSVTNIAQMATFYLK